MKHLKIFSAALLIVSLLFTSCNEAENELIGNDTQLKIIAHHPSQQSRATDTGFTSGDEIGVFVCTSGEDLHAFGNEVNNGNFTFNGSTWEPKKAYYWNEGAYDIYAYYPFISNINDTESMTFSVNNDQTTVNNYSQSDFLWAHKERCKADNSPVDLYFSHLLSRIIVKIQKGVDYTGELPDNFDVYILNTVTDASINLGQGSVDKHPNGLRKTIKALRLSSDTYTAIVVPQNIDTNRPLIELTADNISYLIEGKLSFKSGVQHTVTVTINSGIEQEIDMNGGIDNWN